MAVWISEPTSDGHLAPGTTLFEPQEEDETAGAALLKRHPKFKHIILRPQPSNSGLDPLNWSRWRKELLFLIFLIGSTCTLVIFLVSFSDVLSAREAYLQSTFFSF